MTKARNIADLLDANGDVKSASLDNVPASNDASALTTGTIDNARISLDANEIPNLDTAKITTGTLADSRIPSLAASKITSGTLDAARIDNASLANVTALPFSAGTDWQSTIVTGTTLTAVAGRGYFINTTSNACTVTLPGSASIGDTIQIVDYAGKFATNNIILTSSLKINGSTDNKLLRTDREGVTITFTDTTQGWVATSGVNSGDQGLDPVVTTVDFLVIAGGGSGSDWTASGGGGAGGYRNSFNSETSGGGGSSETALELTPGVQYTVTVGAGGAAAGDGVIGNAGVNSSISGTGITTITSIGGGCGIRNNDDTGSTGGSGGGGGDTSTSGLATGASGTANQGFAGGDATSPFNGSGGGGGGGASAVGSNGSNSGGNGGNGLASSITGSAVTRGGGGGGGTYNGTSGTGGTGGGGNGAKSAGVGPDNATAGGANTGGGGGSTDQTARGGGSGVVILRMATADYSGTTSGSPSVSTSGSDTILTFNASGSYTA